MRLSNIRTPRLRLGHLSLIGLSCMIPSCPRWSNSNSIPDYFTPEATSIQTGAFLRTNGDYGMKCRQPIAQDTEHHASANQRSICNWLDAKQLEACLSNSSVLSENPCKCALYSPVTINEFSAILP